MTYRFGPFVADRTAYRVSRGEVPLELTPKLLDVLFYLLDRPATLVTKEELLDAVWPGANVTDNALAQAMSDLRDALGDPPATPTYIRTVARRGYRFVAPIETSHDGRAHIAPPSASTSAAPHPPGRQTAVAVLDFANVTDDPDIAWLRAGIAETVTSDLGRLDHFRVIDRWRVVQAARRTDGSMHDMAAALDASLLVTGSYQRVGPLLRITARLVDLASGEAIADAKVDGPLEDVFTLQDGIVAAFARELGVPGFAHPPRLGVRETSNLEAYRAYTEGWLKIESLDTDLVPDAIADFARAIARDPRYAIAYAGLASAEFVAYEMTRMAPDPNAPALASGIDHATHAAELDPRLAEAHATLSFLLSSAGRFDEARGRAHRRLDRARQLAPSIPPRPRALGRRAAARLRARADALPAIRVRDVRDGDGARRARPSQQGRRSRPRRGRRAGSAGARGRPLSVDRLSLAAGRARVGARPARVRDCRVRPGARADRSPAALRAEYGAVALVARGQAELATGQAAQALASFQAARLYVEDYPRAWVGEVLALAETDDAAAVDRRDVTRGTRRNASSAPDGTHERGTPRRARRRSTATRPRRSAGSITCSPPRRKPHRLDRADRAVLPAAPRTAGLRDHPRAAGGPGEVAGIPA